MTQIVIRPVETRDLDEVHALNEAAVPHVNSIPRDEFVRFMSVAAYFRVAATADAVVGVLVGFEPGADYASLNFRWFEAEFERFFYIDRVIVAPAHRGGGIAGRLYEDAAAFASGRAPRMTCEVNITPPNEPSMRFHHAQGFREVGRQHTDGGAKEVSLLARPLAS